jgi:hypothetical protein
MVQIWHFKLYNKLSTIQLKSSQRRIDGEDYRQERKTPLRCSQRSSVEETDAEFWQRQEEQKIMLLGLSDRLNKLERAAKDILLLLVAALAIGCAAGTWLKPELAAVAVGGSAADLAVSIGRQ